MTESQSPPQRRRERLGRKEKGGLVVLGRDGAMDHRSGRWGTTGGAGGNEADVRARVAALKTAWLKGGDRAGRDRFVQTNRAPSKYVDSYRRSDLVKYEWNNRQVKRSNRGHERPSRDDGVHAKSGGRGGVASHKMEVLARGEGSHRGGADGSQARIQGDVEDHVGDVRPDEEGGDGMKEMALAGHPRDDYVVESEEGMSLNVTSEEEEEEEEDGEKEVAADDLEERAADLVMHLEKKREAVVEIDNRFWSSTRPGIASDRVRHKSNLAQRKAELHDEEVKRLGQSVRALAVLQGAIDMRILTNEALGENDVDRGEGKGAKMLYKEVQRLNDSIAASTEAIEGIEGISGGNAGPSQQGNERKASAVQVASAPSTRGNTPTFTHGATSKGDSASANKDRSLLTAKKESLVVRAGLTRYDYSALQALADLLAQSPAVKTVGISQNWIMPAGAAILAPSLLSSTQLTSLDLSMNDLRPQGMTSLAQPLGQMERLKVLKLGSNHIQDTGVEALRQPLAELTRLEVLDLSKNKISSAGTQHLIPFLSDAKFLLDLDISGNVTRFSFNSSDGPELMSKLTPCIIKLAALERLSLASNNIFSLGMKYVANIVAEGYGDLKYLNLGGSRSASNKIGAAGAKSLAMALFNKPLVSINLSYCELGPEGMASISSALQYQTCLESLDLCGNAIGPAGAQSLAKGIRSCTSLKVLNLCANEINSGGVQALSSCWGLERGNQIKDLNLSRNPLTVSDKASEKFDTNGIQSLALAIRNSKLPYLHTLDLRESGTTQDTDRMLASAVVAHSHLVSLNGFRVPPSKSPLKWYIPHPVKHAELVFFMQVLQMIPRPTAAAITANLTLYNTMDLSGCGMTRFPVEIFQIPTLEKVDLSNNAFPHIPIDRIVASQALNSLELRRCQNLTFPSENVRERGGAFTMLYIRDSHCMHSTVTLPLLICGLPSAGGSISSLLPLETHQPRLSHAAHAHSRRGSLAGSASQSSDPISRRGSFARRKSSSESKTFQVPGSAKYREWKQTRMDALGDLAGKKLEAPQVWVPATPTSHPCHFEPHDLSGLALSINCKELFYVKKAIFLFAWDYQDLRESKNSLTLFLDALGAHVPMASVILCSVHSAGFDPETMDDHDREIAEAVAKWMEFQSNRRDRVVNLSVNSWEHAPIRITLESPEDGLSALGLAANKAAKDRETAQSTQGVWVHNDTLLLSEAIRLDSISGEYWLDWRNYNKLYADIVFDGDTNRFNSATDALHDLGMIRCLRDADMASDGQSAPRPVLDVVFTSFEGIIKSALQAPVNAFEWKLWEVVHFLRKAQDSLRHPRGTRGTHKARALRWAVGTLGAMAGHGRRLSMTSMSPISAVQSAATPAVNRDHAHADEPLASDGGQVPVPHRGDADPSSGVFKQQTELSQAETKDAGGGDEAGPGAKLLEQPQADAPTPIPEDVVGEQGAE